jgi:hypothetical protein
VTGNFLSELASCPGKRSDRLVNEPDIRRIRNMGFQGDRIDPDPPGLDGLRLDQMTNQFLVESDDPFFTEPLVELDECRGVRNLIHQAQSAEVSPRKPLADLSLHFFITETPTELQVHHPEVDIDCCARPTNGRIKNGLERLKKFTFRKKLVDMLQFLIQPKQLRIDEAFAEAQLAIRLSSHMNVLQRLFCY